MTRLLGMKEEDARKLCTDFMDTIASGKEHAYHYQYVVYPFTNFSLSLMM